MKPVVELSDARLFFAGALTEPQLNHPEGVAFDSEGALWCGGTKGEIYRVAPDGSAIEQVASTDGYALGIAIEDDVLYVCDLKHRTVFRLDTRTRALEPFASVGDGRAIVTPNFPVVDRARGCLYVSDSNVAHQPGPGVYRFDLASGEGGLWYGGDLDFANGMALAGDGSRLYVVESWGYRISEIAIEADGSAGSVRTVIEGISGIADGLSLGPDGLLYIACYAPSQIYRLQPDGSGLELLIADPICDVLCHPTNIAWRGSTLFAASLGGHHIASLDLPPTR
jgi:sugar lactone lactonase YvrE